MIEPAMYFTIGVLIALLFTIALIPLVHNRAERLTIKRLEAAVPVSLVEIEADKDQLRADFAMTARRLETTIEQLRANTAIQMAEIGRKTEGIARLKAELDEKTAALDATDARAHALDTQARTAEDELARRGAALDEAEQRFAAREAELASRAASLNDQSRSSESHRVEVLALQTQVEALKSRLDQTEREARDASVRLKAESIRAEDAMHQLAGMTGKADEAERQAAETWNLLRRHNSEADQVRARIQELEARLAEQGRLLVQKDHELARLGANSAARNTSASTVAEGFGGRIGAIAAEIAQLTALLEGPDSPILATLATAPPPVANDAATNRLLADLGMTSDSPILADRIRLLQHRAAKAAAGADANRTAGVA
ncbi:MAG TPA: hypothetical protein VNQ99_14265 [Xanthobacteraceae bacterium]|nr:hypothetical protein [Xanthobacteraceae bacterium]